MMLRRSALLVICAFALTAPAFAAGEQENPPKQDWSFSGPLGTFDPAQLQRGFKVYREVCQTCHSAQLLSFRTLAEPGGPGYTPAQAAVVASEYKIKDIDDSGSPIERDGRPADYFPAIYANDAQAQATHGAVPPDLSVIAKARGYERGFPRFIWDMMPWVAYQEHGADYVAALLQGYENPPQGFQVPEGTHYNKYFPGHVLKMAPPLQDGQVTYDDGAPATVAQYAKDVSAFLMWAAEPTLDARKKLGLQVMIFLIVLSVLLYFTKKKVWAEVKAHPEDLQPRAPTEYPSRP